MTRSASFSLTDRMIYLRSIPVASMVSPSVLKILAGQLRERRFGHGETLMRLGQPIDGLHLLTEGAVTLRGKERTLGTLEPPQTLGFLGILGDGTGNVVAVAERETTTLELPSSVLIEILEDHFDFLRATLRYLSERMLYEVQELPREALSSRFEGAEPEIPHDRELDLAERLLWLHEASAFKNSNLSALATMAKHLRQRSFATGEEVFRHGDPADYAFWVVSGLARCTDAAGKSWLAAPSSVLGGLEAIGAKRRWFTLSAETPMIGFYSPIAGYLDLLEDDIPLARAFIRRLATDLCGLLEARASRDDGAIARSRDVTNLGPVPVGI